MPVVVVLGPPMASSTAEQDVLVAINRAVASGLHLRADDVYSTFTSAGVAVLGTRAVTPWPIVLIHGSARPRELMDDAITLVREEICARWRCAPDETWVQWVVPA